MEVFVRIAQRKHKPNLKNELDLYVHWEKKIFTLKIYFSNYLDPDVICVKAYIS